MRTRLILPISLLACAAALSAQTMVAGNAAPPAGKVSAQPVAHALQISPGDLLDLSVFDTPELSAKLRVDDHGEVTLPVAGAISVAGLTAEQAGHAVEARFRDTDVLKDPHVAVTVEEYATQGVTVLGEVKTPGVYPLMGAHGVLDLISVAGGLTSAAGKDVTVTHRDDAAHPLVAKIGSKQGGGGAFSVDVHPGDTIMVSHAGVVYVVGDVAKPGGFVLDGNNSLTVLQAIALAQGTNRTASLNHARLIRTIDGERQESPLPLKKILASKAADETLADGDILFVPSSAAKSAMRDVESTLPSVAAATIYHVP